MRTGRGEISLDESREGGYYPQVRTQAGGYNPRVKAQGGGRYILR